MIYLLCAIFDKVIGEYSNPVVCRNEADAFRWFKNYLSRFEDPSDFDLFCLGSYNSTLGSIITDNVSLLRRGVDFYEKK